MDTLSHQDALERLKPQATPEQATEEAPATAEVETPEVQTEEIQVEHEEIELELDDNTEEIPTVEMPSSWSKEDAEIWSELTPEVKEIVANRESKLRSESSRRSNEMSEKEKALEDLTNQTKQKQQELLEALQAIQVQKPSADMLDPDHESYDPDKYHKDNAAWEKSQEKITELNQEIDQERAKELQQWQIEQSELYKQHWPEFLDVEKGPALHNDLIDYAAKAMEITPEAATQALQTTGFHYMKILSNSMKYERAIEKAAAKRQKPKSKALPSGASNPAKSEKVDIKALAKKFERTGDPKDALALLNARKGK